MKRRTPFCQSEKMNLHDEHQLLLTRRQLFGRAACSIGTAALASLLNPRLFAAGMDPALQTHGVLPALHFAPKAERVIYLFMSGGPSHIDLLDYKPADRPKYIEAFFSNINWDTVEQRLKKSSRSVTA